MATPSPRPLADVARDLDLPPEAVLPWGRGAAKVDPAVLESTPGRAGKLVLVSAMTPTPPGEGKTTTSIGLAQGLARRGASVCLALREPSLGPVFGRKGGGTGGGRASLVPATDINLHFTGDLHAISAAHNLLSAAIDNRLHFGGEPAIAPALVQWPRVMDMNDRALRQVVVGLGGATNGPAREASFDITAASELMAMLCLAEGPRNLRTRIDRTLVGYSRAGKAVRAGELGVTGAVLALLRDACWPNLVQTNEGVPAFVHGGPFANIAHGCNSVLATRMALHSADWAITEAGFAFDLGGQKFLEIKCPTAGLQPSLVVMVATVRALRWHGGAGRGTDKGGPSPEAVRAGMANLLHHVAAARACGLPVVVALNRFEDDHPRDLAEVAARCEAAGVPMAASSHFAEGGAGAEALADLVVASTPAQPPALLPSAPAEAPALARITAIADRFYGARGVQLAGTAAADLDRMARLGLDTLPICVAKTHASLSDDPALRGRPTDFDLTVRKVLPNTGAGFLVALTGELSRMPGLPRRPRAERIELVDGAITGVG